MIRKLLLLTCAFALTVAVAHSKKKTETGACNVVTVTDLRTERMVNPMSLDTPTPRFGWRISSTKNDVKQTSYHIIVASTEEKALNGEGDLWDVEAESDRSQWITYAGSELRSDTRCYWRVKIVTTQGSSEWSDVALFNVGLLGESDWTGQWIGLDHAMPWEIEDIHSRLGARYMRSEFETDGEIKRATLYISGLGLYEAFINGRRVGDRVLAPAPTDYRRTVLYDAYDVTELVSKNNAVAVAVGNGRYYTMQQNKKPYKITNFGYPKLRLNLVIEYADGKKKTVSTNSKWKLNADGAIRSNNEYDGEIYDARKELGEWTQPGYDDTGWMDAERVAIPYGTLRGSMAPGMKVLKEIEPVSVVTHKTDGSLPTPDAVIVDLGQNIAGWLKVRMSDINAGDTVRIRFAEKLNDDGSLYRDNLRHAFSTDYYVADGTEQGRWWEPSFTYHGFRYAEIAVVPDDNAGSSHADIGFRPEASDIVGCVISDEMEVTGSFECADTILNKIYRNAVWGVLANYKGLPVDCPQRDERQPWLGDRTRGSFGEAFLFNNNALYDKWARDICEAQREDGCIPDVAPAYWNYYSDNLTWPAALPFAMEMMYLQYGDEAPVRKYYDNVKRWLHHLAYQYESDGLMPRDKYGDWCVPPEEQTMIHSKDSARQTDGTLIATAYYYRLNKLMARFAALLGKDDDKAGFEEKASIVKKAFNEKFLTVNPGTSTVPGHLLYPDSTFYGNNTATANLLPLVFGMIDETATPSVSPDGDEYDSGYIKSEVEKNIIYNIITLNKGQIPCGVIGVQWLMHALTDMGRTDIAWLLATNKNYPGWGYMTEKGATTIWELWNGDTANPAMNSGNHVMLLGDLLSWLYEDIAGIGSDAAHPGFKHIIMSPDFGVDEVNDINASYKSIYGNIVSKWKKTGGILSWHVEIPANTTASLRLPDGSWRDIGSGTHDITADIPWRGYKAPTNNGLQLAADGSRPDSSGKAYSAWSDAADQDSGPVEVDEFLYTSASFPECHSATIVETDDGDLVATYFGGTKERNPDVCIWVSRKEKGSDTWTEPQLVADGVLNDTLRKACWNPVVYQIPDGDLVIYFKIGDSVADWSGWMTVSSDGGRTWSPRKPLQDGYLGPVKNKPVPVGFESESADDESDGQRKTQGAKPVNRLIAPTSVEKGGWRLYFEYSDDMGKTWRRTDYVEADSGVMAIQPAVLTLPDGRLEAVARTRNRQVAVTFSDDNGESWSRLQLIDVPNNNSGLDAVTLRDGRYAMICNDWPIPPTLQKGARTPLSLMLSDDGLHWRHALTIEDSPVSQYSYPSIIQTSDGRVHLIYTWRRQRIKHVVIDIDKL